MPKLTLDLSEIDGNAFVILGKARKVMKKDGINTDIIEKFTKETTSGDYDHLLQTVMKYFDVE